MKEMREFLNQEEASDYLGVSKKTLQKFVLMGLPRYEYGKRRKFYKKSEMDAFMAEKFRTQSELIME